VVVEPAFVEEAVLEAVLAPPEALPLATARLQISRAAGATSGRGRLCQIKFVYGSSAMKTQESRAVSGNGSGVVRTGLVGSVGARLQNTWSDGSSNGIYIYISSCRRTKPY
jgi:hypothetical protein